MHLDHSSELVGKLSKDGEPLVEGGELLHELSDDLVRTLLHHSIN